MDNLFMSRAIQLSIDNVESGQGGPFGALVVKDGSVVAEAVLDSGEAPDALMARIW